MPDPSSQAERDVENETVADTLLWQWKIKGVCLAKRRKRPNARPKRGATDAGAVAESADCCRVVESAEVNGASARESRDFRFLPPLAKQLMADGDGLDRACSCSKLVCGCTSCERQRI